MRNNLDYITLESVENAVNSRKNKDKRALLKHLNGPGDSRATLAYVVDFVIAQGKAIYILSKRDSLSHNKNFAERKNITLFMGIEKPERFINAVFDKIDTRSDCYDEDADTFCRAIFPTADRKFRQGKLDEKTLARVGAKIDESVRDKHFRPHTKYTLKERISNFFRFITFRKPAYRVINKSTYQEAVANEVGGGLNNFRPGERSGSRSVFKPRRQVEAQSPVRTPRKSLYTKLSHSPLNFLRKKTPEPRTPVRDFNVSSDNDESPNIYINS